MVAVPKAYAAADCCCCCCSVDNDRVVAVADDSCHAVGTAD